MESALLKQCSKCKENKPATAEYFAIRSDTGKFRASCRLCGIAYWACWRNDNRVADHHYSQKYRASHLEEERRRDREYRAKRKQENPEREREYIKGYQKAHPEIWRQATQRRRVRKRDLSSTLTPAEYQAILEYYGFACAYCGRPEAEVGKLHQEHVVPVMQSGGYTADNIVPACKHCNSRKGRRTPEQAGMKLRK